MGNSLNTKKMMANSLKELIQEMPFSKITIDKIVTNCGYNRQTFYYHFKDIYDLVEWSCINDASKALSDQKTYDTWETGFIRIFNAVRENKPFIMNVYRCVSRERVEQYLNPLTDSLLKGVVEEKANGMTVREEDKDFIAKVYSYIFVGIMLDWIGDNMKDDPEALVKKLALVIHGDVSSALERFRTDKNK